MPFEISITRIFSAAHALRLPGGVVEPLHGHDWQLTVTVGANQLDAIGTVMDFHDLETRVESIIGPWRNRNLNDCPPFDVTNPSAEAVVKTVAHGLQLPPGVRLVSVSVTEAPGCVATYRPASA